MVVSSAWEGLAMGLLYPVSHVHPGCSEGEREVEADGIDPGRGAAAQ